MAEQLLRFFVLTCKPPSDVGFQTRRPLWIGIVRDVSQFYCQGNGVLIVSGSADNGRIGQAMKGADMLEVITRPETALELILDLQPEEALEWKAQVNQQYTDWQDVESATHLVALIQGISRDGDWLVVQTKGSNKQPLGRYAQAMNTGSGFQVEVAQICRGVTRNWRVGLGPAADAAGNTPFGGVVPSQNLSPAEASEVVVSWLNGQGLPLGYGAALHDYG